MDSDELLTVAADWVWKPHDAVRVDAHGIRLQVWRGEATVLSTSGNEDAPGVLVERVLALARESAASAVVWAVHPLTPVPDLADALTVRGATVAEELDISVRDLSRGVDEPDMPPNITVERVDTPQSLSDIYTVDHLVFGFALPDAEFRRNDIALLRDEVAAGLNRSDLRYVARVDGEPVGSAGMTLDASVAKLWGGAVLPAYRRRGVYRALLSTRLAEGAARGATMALVKGRVSTSAPILKGVGFITRGRETHYRMALDDG